MKKYILFIFLNLLAVQMIKAQFTNEESLSIAQEYFEKGEFEKAKEYYEKLSKDSKNITTIYANYLTTLTKLKDFKNAESLCKKMIKNEPRSPAFRIDYAVMLEEASQIEKSDKEFNKIIDDFKKTEESVIEAYNYLTFLGKYDWCEKLLLTARKVTKERNTFSLELADTYAQLQKTDLMIAEYVQYASLNQNNIEIVKSHLQDNLVKAESFEKLETILVTELQKSPEEATFNELLLWLYLQQKRFARAFTQAKSLDKRYRLEGIEMINFGQLAMKNKDYDASSQFFEYVIKTYPNSENYYVARNLYLKSREEFIKNTYPIQINDIKNLITEYQKMIDEWGKNGRTFDAIRSMALLKAFYLDEKKQAIDILNEAITLGIGTIDQQAQAKIDLGDIYLLLGEDWESTLLYSQVEKMKKEHPLGYEAKLKNAKLSYYKGEFSLAVEHLNILKEATTREIANDALDLSLLIQDNTTEDSLGTALKEYSKVELLIFQKQDEKALAMLNELAKKFDKEPLTDEILFQKGMLYRKMGKFNEALTDLENVFKNHGEDILGDDAYFYMGKIYEEDLKNKEKAKEIYQEFLTKYSGSVFNAEARKRFRILRGDFVN
ncbi:MAG: hypothetical protein EAZ85_14115 [Bacteroidetes bacterium]|nr:MAG: hypothetical protein EAZ85_14115 [Bacteroidota bacterium]TAG86051.1 MAG: hypothetical protein EAZ20_13595 [Bacteroidota bacterium]